MPKFLNHLNLNSNQLKNAKLEITDSPTQAEGIIHYHASTNTVRVWTGTGNSDYYTLGDNDVATSSNAGIVELFSDTVQSVAANSVTETTGRTYGIQFNGDGQMVVNVPWTDSSALTQEQVEDFAAGMITGATHTGLTTTYDDGAGTLALAVDGVLQDLDTLGAASADGQFIVATGSGTFAYESGSTVRTSLGLGTSAVLNTAAIADGGTGVATADQIHTFVTTQTDTIAADTSGNAATASAVAYSGLTGTVPTWNQNTTGTAAGLSSTLAIGSGGTGQTSAAAAANALLNTSQGGALTIGDSSDVITIGGDLVVTGAQTTTLSNTVKTGDNMLELATNNSANSTDFGWYGKFVDSGTKYAGMHWDASDTKFKLGYGDDAPGSTIAWDNAGELEVGKLTTTDLVIGGHTISDVDISSEDSGADDHLMTASAIVSLIADNENNFLTAHPSITEASSNLTNSGRTYIQSIGLDSNGHVTSVSTATETVTDTNTQRSAGTGMSLSTNTLNVNVDGTNSEAPQNSTTTSGRTYKVQVDGNDNLVVNVPWSDTNTNTQLAIANTSEAVAGADDTKAMTAAKVADRSVLATIDVSDSTFASNLYAEITHGLDTADIIVQLYDIHTEETVVADVFRTDKAGTASTNKIKVVFSAAPASTNDIRVLITSLKGGQTGTVAYS